MNDRDYADIVKCSNFVIHEMQFYSFQDFIDNAIGLRRLYQKVLKDDNFLKIIQIYQWYVFATPISYNRKCAIWEFLNMRMSYKELVGTKDHKRRYKKYKFDN